MGDLARQRSARDLWISRSHVRAMATGTLVLAGTAFVVGFAIGRDAAPPPAIDVAAPNDGDLIELLARVEAAARPQGGIEDLTFPDALAGVEAGLSVPAPAEAEAPTAVVEPAPAEPVVGDAPVGKVAIEVARFDDGAEAAIARERLRAAELDARVVLELVDGRPVHHVVIGGWADEEAAAAALAELGPRIVEVAGSEATILSLP